MGLNDFVKAVQVMKPARQYIFALKRLEIFWQEKSWILTNGVSSFESMAFLLYLWYSTIN